MVIFSFVGVVIIIAVEAVAAVSQSLSQSLSHSVSHSVSQYPSCLPSRRAMCWPHSEKTNVATALV